MSSIDEYFGLNEPKKKEPKQEMSLQERVNAISEIGELCLGKTPDYFEEVYKGLEPNPELDKEIEKMFTESVLEPETEDDMDYTMKCYSDRLSEIMNAWISVSLNKVSLLCGYWSDTISKTPLGFRGGDKTPPYCCAK